MSPVQYYETRHAAADALATHRHRHAYAALVLDGRHVEASLDGPIECEPGTVLLHPAFHAHGNRFGRGGAHVANITLRGDFGIGRTQAWHVQDLRTAREVFARCPERLPALLAESGIAMAPALPAWQQAFVAALDEGDEAIAAIAARLDVSAAHASRALLKSHGMAPQALRREGRWRRALAALRGDGTLADIAAESGFADQSHLTRVCRVHSGLPPAALRLQIKCVQDGMKAALAQCGHGTA
jgi:AraC-like DNA-binding protein